MGGGGSSRIFPCSPEADHIRWGGGGSSRNFQCNVYPTLSGDRGDWGPLPALGHFSYFLKYLDFEKQDACVTYHSLLTMHSAT